MATTTKQTAAQKALATLMAQGMPTTHSGATAYAAAAIKATPIPAAVKGSVQYVITAQGLNHSPKAVSNKGNSTMWALVQGIVAANNGTITKAQYKAIQPALPTAIMQSNTMPYWGYAVKMGWLAPAS